MAVSLVPWLVTVRDAALCPGEKRTLTGSTDNACAPAAGPVRRIMTTAAASALAAAISRHEFRKIMKAPIGKRG